MIRFIKPRRVRWMGDVYRLDSPPIETTGSSEKGNRQKPEAWEDLGRDGRG